MNSCDELMIDLIVKVLNHDLAIKYQIEQQNELSIQICILNVFRFVFVVRKF